MTHARKQIEFAAERLLGRLRWVAGKRARDKLNAAAPELGRAIDAALRSQFTPDEAALTDRIEALRRHAMRSQEPIEQIDFGAGKADETLSAEAMASGRKRDRTVAQMTGASKSPFWAGVLFRLVRNLRRENALELGTCLGVSAAYQAGAMDLNGKGALTSLEGAPALADISRRHLDRLGLGGRVVIVRGRFSDTLPAVLRDRGPFDFVFIDGHHDGGATLAYCDQIQPHLAPGAVVVFDDIDWSDSMKRAWRQLAADPRFGVTVDLGRLGVAQLATPGGPPPTRVRLRVV
jgi:predicted O-methyltransferase YrrM